MEFMKKERDLGEGLYFVHGYYPAWGELRNDGKIARNQMILLKDNIEDIYAIDAYDVNLDEMRLPQRPFAQGEFVYVDDKGDIQSAESHPTSIMYTELNRLLINSLGYENYGNQATEVENLVSDVHSYHINVGHGNCSIIVFSNGENYEMWMIDCSVFDFTNKKHYGSNLDECMKDISNKFRITRLTKLLITHLHYDHINGIEYLKKKDWIDKDTEVWMNIQYPWKQPTYIRILSQLNKMGVKFIDPVVANSTKEINILYPNISFNQKNPAPDENINNASVLYQICLNGKRMLFTGDIETEGWEKVTSCFPYMNNSDYYCISHHGSITGHIRTNCVAGQSIRTLTDCVYSKTRERILMGRKDAYKDVYNQTVVKDLKPIITEQATHYIEIEWDKCTVVKK